MTYQQVRRVTVRRGDDGLWRWTAQGSNWRPLATSDKPTKRKPTKPALQRRFPNAEIVFL